MGIEDSKNAIEIKRKSPSRLSLALEAIMKIATNKIEVEGRENIEKVPKGKRVIIACSHISDMDIGLTAYALKDDFDLLITHQSVQTFLEEPGISLGMKAAGSENFMPIDWLRSESGKQGKFNPDNFIELKEYVDKSGKTPLIAAHNPSKRWQLEKGGYAAVMLAQLEKDAVILPVSVNVKSDKPVGMAESRTKTLKKRPEVEVFIGEPFELPAIEGIEKMKSIMDKRKLGQPLSQKEKKIFYHLREALARESNVIMEKIASQLPEEKRGMYGNK
jgi:hypothetical protein